MTRAPALSAAVAPAVQPPLRRHQRESIAALESAWAQNHTRCWVVLPPGAGKTRVGLEAARRVPGIGRTVVFGPNSAIQSQWEQQARDFGVDVGTDRALDHELTALTYQSLAVFDADDEVDDDLSNETGEGSDAGSLLARLHDNGRALVATLKEAGPILLVLDECHHLLEVWGRLLEELLAELPEAWVLGLTATPPEAMTAEQKSLVDTLFGPSVYAASIPAVVREGDLAPFAEMVWLTTPTESERDWLRASAERFRELVTQLMEPGFGSTGFLTWLDLRFLGDAPWFELSSRHPALCDAALRMHHHGLLGLPTGARLSEEHRTEPTTEDWAVLIGDWISKSLTQSGEDGDEEVIAAVRRALPSVGYQWTKRGIRRGRTPVDRVLARSVAKTRAAVEITVHEHAALGERMRTLVLCDHERASATLPADLRGVLDQQSGSAHSVLAGLVADPQTAALAPLMVTGKTVAGAPRTLALLQSYAESRGVRGADRLVVEDVGDGLAHLSGPWSSRTWVPVVTRFFQAGQTQVLVGTRGLLGEGWDARRITGLIDLSAATTTTAVVQTRGRALRTDPDWADKVALNWSVVCVSDEHPKGRNDWDRLVRKHQGFLAVDEDGDIVDGVAHIDPALSPFVPPETAAFDEVNARMLVRAQDRDSIRERWRVGTPYVDELGHTLRIRATRPAVLGAAVAPVAVVSTGTALEVRAGAPVRQRRLEPVQMGMLAIFAVAVSLGSQIFMPLALLPITLGVAWILLRRSATAYGRQLIAAAAEPLGVVQIARAVADGLREAGVLSVGAEAVQVDIDHEGRYRCRVLGVSEESSMVFANALDEVVSPIVDPRYVLSRYVVAPGPVSGERARRAAKGLLEPDGEVWHAVPTVVGRRNELVTAYAAAWTRWIGGGAPVFTRSPVGAGILAAQRGADPFHASTVVRRHWS